MARRRSHVQQVLRRIEELNGAEQCELLEQLLLRHRRPELGWEHLDRLRTSLPRRAERTVKRDVDAAVRDVRREFANPSGR